MKNSTFNCRHFATSRSLYPEVTSHLISVKLAWATNMFNPEIPEIKNIFVWKTCLKHVPFVGPMRTRESVLLLVYRHLVWFVPPSPRVANCERDTGDVNTELVRIQDISGSAVQWQYFLSIIKSWLELLTCSCLSMKEVVVFIRWVKHCQ